MRILIVSSIFPPEPVVSSFLSFDIASKLQENGNNVKVLCPKPTRPHGFKFSNTSEPTVFERIVQDSYTCSESRLFGRLMESFSFGIHCSRYIRKHAESIDVIYTNTWPLFSQALIVRAAKKMNIKIVTHIQDIYPESLINKIPIFKKLVFYLLLPIDKYTLRNSDYIITICTNMKLLLVRSRKLNKDKVGVIFNWQDEKRFLDYNPKNKTDLVRQQFTFMFLGSLGPVAYVDHLLLSFGATDIPNSRLIIAGSGSEKAYLESITNQFPDKDIQFWEAPFEKVPEIQFKADVLILNLKPGAAQFALPSKLLAYMFSAKPILSCVDEESDTADIIRSSQCGWVVKPGDRDALIKKMNEVRKLDRLELETMGKKGFEYALQYLSKEVNLKKIIDCIYNCQNHD